MRKPCWVRVGSHLGDPRLGWEVPTLPSAWALVARAMPVKPPPHKFNLPRAPHPPGPGMGTAPGCPLGGPLTACPWSTPPGA